MDGWKPNCSRTSSWDYYVTLAVNKELYVMHHLLPTILAIPRHTIFSLHLFQLFEYVLPGTMSGWRQDPPHSTRSQDAMAERRETSTSPGRPTYYLVRPSLSLPPCLFPQTVTYTGLIRQITTISTRPDNLDMS